MTLTIRRTADDTYQLEDADGVIETYKQTRMSHPEDWRDDAAKAGHTVHGPYDWRYIDGRPESD